MEQNQLVTRDVDGFKVKDQVNQSNNPIQSHY